MRTCTAITELLMMYNVRASRELKYAANNPLISTRVTCVFLTIPPSLNI